MAPRILPLAIGGVTVIIATLLIIWPSSVYLPAPAAWAWVMGTAGMLMLISGAMPRSAGLRATAGGLLVAAYLMRATALVFAAILRDVPAQVRASGIIGALVWAETASLILIVWARVVTPEGEAWASSQPPRTPSPSPGSSPGSPPS